MNSRQMEESKKVLGENTVEMLLKIHQDALWILENLGVECRHSGIREAFIPHESEGRCAIYENRIYISPDLVEQALDTAPGADDFFVPKNSFFIGGTAPYVYDDLKKEGGLMPSVGHMIRIAKAADKSSVVAGMGRGVKLKSEILQIRLMNEYCRKPLYFAATTEASIREAAAIYERRKNLMIVFCLTRPPLTVNENISDAFYRTASAGLPLFISAMPMAGISAPYCYSGVLAMAHAEVLFGICAAQLIRPKNFCIHAGFPAVADPRIQYNPNYGLISHHLLNILLSHLNLILDLPTCQSATTTHEEHLTEKAIADARAGHALCKKYGFHMIRHSFAFLRYLTDFSFEKLERVMEVCASATADDAPEVVMPEYDPRGLESIQRIGLGMYRDDPLTTANLEKVFVE